MICLKVEADQNKKSTKAPGMQVKSRQNKINSKPKIKSADSPHKSIDSFYKESDFNIKNSFDISKNKILNLPGGATPGLQRRNYVKRNFVGLQNDLTESSNLCKTSGNTRLFKALSLTPYAKRRLKVGSINSGLSKSKKMMIEREKIQRLSFPDAKHIWDSGETDEIQNSFLDDLLKIAVEKSEENVKQYTACVNKLEHSNSKPIVEVFVGRAGQSFNAMTVNKFHMNNRFSEISTEEVLGEQQFLKYHI